MKITGQWTLADLKAGKIGAPKNNLKVMSCFHCGGGSTMGYKLAGFDVMGGVEIDPEMMAIYRANHNPRHSFLMGVKEFCLLPDSEISAELFNLDVLDGSPPCSSFSMAGDREKAWGEKKKFREGQADQVLDDLFFDFINVAKKLKPKMVVAENVKGMLVGNARGYVKDIFAAFRAAGYIPQLFLLNAGMMGVPQRRERVFFVARRADLNIDPISFDFNEADIPLKVAFEGLSKDGSKEISPRIMHHWRRCIPGKSLATTHEKKHLFNWIRLSKDRSANTLASGSSKMLLHWSEPRCLSKQELIVVQSFPMDYDFLETDPGYVLGMSVPPLMMQRIALGIAELLLKGAPSKTVASIPIPKYEAPSTPDAKEDAAVSCRGARSKKSSVAKKPKSKRPSTSGDAKSPRPRKSKVAPRKRQR